MKRALEEQYGGEEEVISCLWLSLTSILFNGFFFSLLFLSIIFWRHFILQLPPANPGFNNTPFKFTKYSNAYMLVYIRESDKEKIICDVDEKDIAEHLRVWLSSSSIILHDCHILGGSLVCLILFFQIRLKKEQEEKEHKKKEKAEAHLYTIIKVFDIIFNHLWLNHLIMTEVVFYVAISCGIVEFIYWWIQVARQEDLTEQIGRVIYFDLVDHDKVRSFRIQKQLPFTIFKVMFFRSG